MTRNQLANAHASIQVKFISEALKTYHALEKCFFKFRADRIRLQRLRDKSFARYVRRNKICSDPSFYFFKTKSPVAADERKETASLQDMFPKLNP